MFVRNERRVWRVDHNHVLQTKRDDEMSVVSPNDRSRGIQADMLPSLASPLWDTSGLVDNSSMLGKVLQGLLGYDAQPSGMQMVFFVAVFAEIVMGMGWARRRASSPASATPVTT